MNSFWTRIAGVALRKPLGLLLIPIATLAVLLFTEDVLLAIATLVLCAVLYSYYVVRRLRDEID